MSVCLSVRVSVRLSRADVVPKQRKLRSQRTAPGFCSCLYKVHPEIRKGALRQGAFNETG